MEVEKYIVSGLPSTIYYIPNFITEKQEEFLLKCVDSAPSLKWTQLSNRRLQNWGGKPESKGMLAEPIPSWLESIMSEVSPMFTNVTPNHVLVNEYLPGQGIMPHEDGPLFHPVVTTVSLGSHTVLDFYSLPSDHSQSLEERYIKSILVDRKSLLVVKNSAYTHHMHGIKEISTDEKNPDTLMWISPSSTLPRTRRVSLTIRNVPKVKKIPIFLSKK